MRDDAVIVFYTNQRGGEPGPNPGYVYAQVSSDGVNFEPYVTSDPLFLQRDVDVKVPALSFRCEVVPPLCVSAHRQNAHRCCGRAPLFATL